MSERAQSVLLELRDVVKSFGATKALSGIDFDLRAGEIHAVCGENGAGKSTLIKVLSGVLQQDSGTFTLMGSEVLSNTPKRALANGIATIYQENSLFQYLTVAENIFVGNEPLTRLRLVDRPQMNRLASRIFARLGIALDVQAPVSSLAGADQKLVEIARAFRRNASVLIMDEPTASFGHQETRLLFDVVREVARSGTGVIFISHHLEEVFEIADRVTVIRDGRWISTRSAAESEQAVLIREMVGRDVDQMRKRAPPGAGEVVLGTHGLSGEGIHEVSISVRSGEVVGIAGLVGAGRSELLETIFGRFRAASGVTVVNGKVLNAASPLAAMKAGLCLVTEDRKLNGLFLGQSVGRNMSVAFHSKYPSWLVDARRIRILVEAAIAGLSIKVRSQGTTVSALSGGNQQKVVIGKWMLTDPDIFLFDEPTRGIDVGAKAEIYKKIDELVEAGKAILMVSSELPEVVGLCDRVYVMKSGRIVSELVGDEINEHRILEQAL